MSRRQDPHDNQGAPGRPRAVGRLDRRSLLRGSAAVAVGGLLSGGVLDLAGCGGEPLPELGGLSGDEVLLGLYRTADTGGPVGAARRALAALDLSWLRPGDSVMVKVASNSGRDHPAVTAPSSVTALCQHLLEAGAGRVVVADQAGVQQVRLVEGDRRFSSTRAMFERNGLLAAAEDGGADLVFFDDLGWDEGYIEATLPEGHHWQKPAHISRAVLDVDHIVYAPRLACHSLAGYTHGAKIAIGFLRDDSRKHLHHDAAFFYEKYVELSFAEEIRSRLRLVFTFVEKLLLHQGPDFGTVALADPALCIASSSLGHHEAVSVALLTLFEGRHGPDFQGLAYGPWADAFNYAFLTYVVESSTGIPWGPDAPEPYSSFRPHHYPAGVGEDRSLSHAFRLAGGVPDRVPVRLDGVSPDPQLLDALGAYSGGILEVPGSS